MYLVNIAIKYRYNQLTYQDQLILAEAILKRESYTAGYNKPIVTPTHFHKYIWSKYDNEARMNPGNAPYVLQNKRGENRVRYLNVIMDQYPTFLHSMYRYATKCLGVDETAARLSVLMMNRAKEAFPDCPVRSTLKMTRHYFWDFFYCNGGKLKRPITKPRLTPEHIKDRIVFAKKWLERLESEEKFYYCFLDEKWFYTSSRRKKMKVLPPATFESVKDSFVTSPKTRSRRFPCKVMYMGIVCPPVEGLSDGKVMMKRVSRLITTENNLTINILFQIMLQTII